MILRYLTSENNDISNLVETTHQALIELGYQRDRAQFFFGQNPKLFEEHLYTSGVNVILARYSFGPKYEMKDAKDRLKGYCNGALGLVNLNSDEIARIDNRITATHQEDI